MDTKQYFSEKANNYDENRMNGILKFLVDKEREAIFRMLEIKKNEEILDAGSGSGFYAKLIKSHGAIPYCIDFSEKMINKVKAQGIDGEVANIENFKLDKKFDKALCAGALEFTKDPVKVAYCLRKHLKEGGYIVILYPRFNLFGLLYKLFHLLHGINIKLFTLSDIKTICVYNNLHIGKKIEVHLFGGVVKLVSNELLF